MDIGKQSNLLETKSWIKSNENIVEKDHMYSLRKTRNIKAVASIGLKFIQAQVTNQVSENF